MRRRAVRHPSAQRPLIGGDDARERNPDSLSRSGAEFSARRPLRGRHPAPRRRRSRSCSASSARTATRRTAGPTASAASARPATTRRTCPSTPTRSLAPYIDRMTARRAEHPDRRGAADVRDDQRHDRQGEVHPGHAELAARVQPRARTSTPGGCFDDTRHAGGPVPGHLQPRRRGANLGRHPVRRDVRYLSQAPAALIRSRFVLPYEISPDHERRAEVLPDAADGAARPTSRRSSRSTRAPSCCSARSSSSTPRS